ncbi:MAG: PAS domain S-box protein, partial [Pseudomonadota bacterium]
FIAFIIDITERRQTELALKRFQAIIDSTGDAIISKTPDGIIQSWNQGAEHLFGYTAAEVIGKPMQILIPADRVDEEPALLSRIVRGERVKHFPTVRQCKDGRLIQISVTLSPVLDDQGRVVAVSKIARDITQQLLAQEQLVKLSKAVENSPAIVVIVDTKGTMEYVNPKFTEVTGYSAEEAIGQNPRILQSGKATRAFYENLWQTLLAGQVWQGEFHNRKKNGEEYFELATISPLRNNQGVVTHFVGVKEDITERKQREKEAAEFLRKIDQQNLRWDLAADSAQIGVWDWAIPENRLIWDQRMYALYGVREADFSGAYQAWQDGLHPDDKARGDEEIHQTLRGERDFDTEFRVVWPTGEIRYIKAAALILRDAEGKPLRMVGVNYDITDRKQNEEALRQARDMAEAANRAKGDFLANMSHEIRTPMNAVIGLTHLCLNTGLSEKQRDYLEKVLQAAQSLLGIINDILDFSKIEAGKLLMERIPFDLESVLDHLASITVVQAEEKALELSMETALDVPPHLIGDPLRLGQVLLNLVANAIKFTEQGEVHVCLELVEATPRDVVLRFRVRDTGIGLSAAQIANLFKPFTQA